MKKYLILVLFFVLGLFSSSTIYANDYRNIDFYFTYNQLEHKIDLSIYNSYSDIVEMKLYKDEVFIQDLKVDTPLNKYKLTGFIKDVIYEFYILYKLKDDNNFYRTIINTFVSNYDIVHEEDLEENPPINLNAPNGVGKFRKIQPTTYEFNYTYPENLIGQKFVLEFEDMPFWLQAMVDYDIFLGVLNNVIQQPTLENKTIKVDSKDTIMKLTKDNKLSDIFIYINFNFPIDFIRSITYQYYEQSIIALGIPIGKKELINKTILPSNTTTVGLFKKYTWKHIERSDNKDYQWKIFLGSFYGKKITEIEEIKINFTTYSINYDDYKVDSFPQDPRNPENPFPTLSSSTLNFYAFFKALFNIKSLIDLLSVITLFFKEFLISILFIIFFPYVLKFGLAIYQFIVIILNSILSFFNKNKKYELR